MKEPRHTTMYTHVYIHEISKLRKPVKRESKFMVFRGWEEGIMECDCLMDKKFPFEVMKVSWN